MYAQGTANMRTSTIAGIMTQTTSATGGSSELAARNPIQGSCTTIYQNWFLGGAVNLKPLIDRAEEQGPGITWELPIASRPWAL